MEDKEDKNEDKNISKLIKNLDCLDRLERLINIVGDEVNLLRDTDGVKDLLISVINIVGDEVNLLRPSSNEDDLINDWIALLRQDLWKVVIKLKTNQLLFLAIYSPDEKQRCYALGQLSRIMDARALPIIAEIAKDPATPDRVRKVAEQARDTITQFLDIHSTDAEQVLESFRGKVDLVEGNIAHLTLVDSKGRESFADYDAEELASQDISEGTLFTCTIKKRNKETVIAFEPIPRRELSDDEWHQICQETEEKLGDYDPTDDY